MFASLEHKFDNSWRVKGTLSHDTYAYDELMGYASNGYPVQSTGAGLGLWAGRWGAKPEQTSFDLYATGPFSLLGREHELVLGTTFARTTYNTQTYGLWRFPGWDSSIANIYTWDGRTPAAPETPPNGTTRFHRADHQRLRHRLRLRPTDSLSVLLGAGASQAGATTTARSTTLPVRRRWTTARRPARSPRTSAWSTT
ncbi:hypothetical protein ACU4GD_10775 [Cupriavidus basilensis]